MSLLFATPLSPALLLLTAHDRSPPGLNLRRTTPTPPVSHRCYPPPPFLAPSSSYVLLLLLLFICIVVVVVHRTRSLATWSQSLASNSNWPPTPRCSPFSLRRTCATSCWSKVCVFFSLLLFLCPLPIILLLLLLLLLLKSSMIHRIPISILREQL